MSIVEWNEETKKEIQDMIDEGITSFKLYMTYPAMIVDDEDLYKIVKALNEKGCFAGVHCENAGVIDALIQEAKAEGRLGPENHPLVRPDTMEAEAVHRLLVIAKGGKSTGNGSSSYQPKRLMRKSFAQEKTDRLSLQKPVPSIWYWMTVFIQTGFRRRQVCVRTSDP